VPPRRAPDPEGEVVELSPDQPPASEPPDSARYLSDRNTRVDRETASRHGGQYPRLAPRPEAGAAGRRGGIAGAPGPRRDGAEAQRQGRSASPEQRARRRDEALALLRPEEAGDVAARRPGAERSEEPRGGDGSLGVGEDAASRIAGGPNLDGHREVEEGEETWLSSREFRFATYLNQMRREIGDEWYPRVRAAVRDRDPSGGSFFYRERTVVLSLALDPSGELKDVSVLRSSTLPFVDEIAIASVRQAQPFPNPPRAMFEEGAPVRVPFAFTIYPAEGRGVLRWRPPFAP
jgi:TonB family protein